MDNKRATLLKEWENFMTDSIREDMLLYCDDSGVVKSEYKSLILSRTLKNEGWSDENINLVLTELSPLLSYNNCHITISAIFKLNGEIFIVRDTNHDINVIKDYLDEGKIITIYSITDIRDGIIYYRYSINH
jgi:hypothetical protein